MSKPKIIIDPQPRTVDLIFDAKAQTQLCNLADLTVFDAGPMSTEMLEEALRGGDYNWSNRPASRETR